MDHYFWRYMEHFKHKQSIIKKELISHPFRMRYTYYVHNKEKNICNICFHQIYVCRVSYTKQNN